MWLLIHCLPVGSSVLSAYSLKPSPTWKIANIIQYSFKCSFKVISLFMQKGKLWQNIHLLNAICVHIYKVGIWWYICFCVYRSLHVMANWKTLVSLPTPGRLIQYKSMMNVINYNNWQTKIISLDGIKLSAMVNRLLTFEMQCVDEAWGEAM